MNSRVPGLSSLFCTQTSFFPPFHSDSMNRCILSALSLIMVSVTCLYLSIVKAVVAWPRLLETVFTSTPFCSANVAYPCLRSWKRSSGIPICLAIVLNCLQTVCVAMCDPRQSVNTRLSLFSQLVPAFSFHSACLILLSSGYR